MNASLKQLIITVLHMAAWLSAIAGSPHIEFRQPVVPVLSGLHHSPVLQMTAITGGNTPLLKEIALDLGGSTDTSDILSVGLYVSSDSTSFDRGQCIGNIATEGKAKVKLAINAPLYADTTYMWLGVTLRDSIDLTHHVALKCTRIDTDRGTLRFRNHAPAPLRTGVAIHTAGSNGVASCRIPGIATAPDGTLLAIYDARYDSSRDLQGDIDIALQRSYDGGSTWTPMQPVLDMGTYGGLAEKHNGVSDACILVDRNTGRIFVAGLWMHGMLDSNGKWIEGLDSTSDYWIHQWKGRGSQPGTDIRQTCQFLITHSDDGGITWSLPDNITAATKRPEWWLFAPAPGQGITLSDGTLVFPTQGRDCNGIPFSNITYSTDHGNTWTTSNPAYDDVTECNAAELSDGSIMLNMRDNRNRGHLSPNGRRVCTTTDLGNTWTEHPTSRKVLTEPTCMASLYRHEYILPDSTMASVLLFANPSNHKVRRNLTLRASLDDGATWPEANSILFDETRGMGYSSITAITPEAIGILYESGLADMVFVRIELNEILNRQ